MLFARRDIKIGEELTFDYKIVTEESIGDDISVGSQVKSEKVRDLNKVSQNNGTQLISPAPTKGFTGHLH